MDRGASAVADGRRDDVLVEGTDLAGEREFTDAVLAFLATARRTRGRVRPLFHDVTVPQLVLLDAVQQCGADGVGAVAGRTGLSQPTVTRGAASLEQSGLIRRESPGEDGRRTVLSLTELGRTQLDHKRALVALHFARIWEDLDPRQREVAAPLLRRLVDLVEHLA